MSSTSWTAEENKLFEDALVQFDEDSPDRWQKVAQAVGGGKSVEEVKMHYEDLIYDIRQIEAGLIPIPKYKSCINGDENGTSKVEKQSQESDEDDKRE